MEKQVINNVQNPLITLGTHLSYWLGFIGIVVLKPNQRLSLGNKANLLRLSGGTQNPKDLISTFSLAIIMVV
jgi:cystathionine beta-lyase/cystathionine gamma-synthase